MFLAKKYQAIKDNYMDASVMNLDRHKVAAIIVFSLLETKVVRYKELDEGLIFIGDILISLKTGLSYMLAELNEKLSTTNVNIKIQEFELPRAQSCKTDYLSIMCRNIYLAKKNDDIAVLELAEKLFLLEYILLQKNNIDPDILIEY